MTRDSDTEVADYYGKFPLHHVVENPNEGCTTGLLDYGVNVNSKDKECRTALHIARRHGHLVIVNILLAQGIDM